MVFPVRSKGFKVESEALFSRKDDAPALINGLTGEAVSYAKLRTLVRRRADALAACSGAMLIVGASTSIEFVVDYLALMEVGATVALVATDTSDAVLQHWMDAYRPDAWWGLINRDSRAPSGNGREPMREAVLLPTSGSTGNPKFVRLTRHNLATNAAQIVEALKIDEGQRVMAHLPLHYSYGLSVLNSHLMAGSTVVLCDISSVRADFWRVMREQEVTTLPGVPFSYDLFVGMGLLTMDLPSLRHLTQAGGRLARDTILDVHSALSPRGVQFWVMYGQTEATARMSVLPPEALPERAGSVGFAVPGSSLAIEGAAPGVEGEIVFRGENVMLGYAECRDDVIGTDLQHGVLSTGDLGRVDEDGCLWIVGRSRRIAKVFGARVNLDDVEHQLAPWGALAVINDDDRILLFLERGDSEGRSSRAAEGVLSLPRHSIRLRLVDELPRLASGKVDYRALEALRQTE